MAVTEGGDSDPGVVAGCGDRGDSLWQSDWGGTEGFGMVGDCGGGSWADMGVQGGLEGAVTGVEVGGSWRETWEGLGGLGLNIGSGWSSNG